MSDTSTTIPRPPSSARSSMIPETAPPSLYAGSVVAPPPQHRKLRLRIVTRHPLPELHFLAPFDPSDATCFARLQQFIWAHLKAKGGGGGGVVKRGGGGAERLQLQMDDFEVTFGDPEILRDGDTVEVYVREEEKGQREQEEEEQEVAAVVGAVESDDQEEDGEDAEEREAILEASRVAALLRAGLHKIVDDDDDTFPARPSALDDLPRMPALPPPPAPKHDKGTSSKASTSLSLPAPPLPPMPTSFARGPAAAMAAFEAKRKAMASQFNAQASMRVTSTGKRKRSASSSSSSSSNLPSSSSSSSSSDSSDSDSDSSDVDSDSSSSGSDASSSAPSEHPIATDRPPRSHKSPSPTPPGSGTNRTKRRNQMRRKKLNLLREAENLAAFQKAQVRAALREAGVGPGEAGEAVGGEAGGEGGEGGEGVRIKGSAEAASRESGSGSGGGASVPVTEVVERLAVDIECVVGQREEGKGKDGEQGEEGEKGGEKQGGKEAEKLTEAEKAQPRLGDMQPGQAAYGGQVPEGMVVRHVDCQSYFDEACAMVDAQAKEFHKKEKAKKKHRQAPGEEEAQQDGFYLDYGEPSACGDAERQRKKMKLELSSTHLSDSDSDHPLPAPTTDPANPVDTWARIRTTYSPGYLMVHCAAEPVDVADVSVGTGVMWEALALDPETRMPGMMRFVGVVVGKNEEGVCGVRLEVVGPLRNEATLWNDYEMEKEVWSEDAGSRPETVWLV